MAQLAQPTLAQLARSWRSRAGAANPGAADPGAAGTADPGAAGAAGPGAADPGTAGAAGAADPEPNKEPSPPGEDPLIVSRFLFSGRPPEELKGELNEFLLQADKVDFVTWATSGHIWPHSKGERHPNRNVFGQGGLLDPKWAQLAPVSSSAFVRVRSVHISDARGTTEDGGRHAYVRPAADEVPARNIS